MLKWPSLPRHALFVNVPLNLIVVALVDAVFTFLASYDLRDRGCVDHGFALNEWGHHADGQRYSQLIPIHWNVANSLSLRFPYAIASNDAVFTKIIAKNVPLVTSSVTKWLL